MLLPRDVEKMSDEEILRSFEPPEAAKILYGRYRAYLYTLTKDVMKSLHGRQFVSMEDLLQSAVLGLLYAVNTFDPSYNTKFITYLTLLVKREILKEARRHMPITPPRTVFEVTDDESKSALEQYLETCNFISLSHPVELSDSEEAVYIDVEDERSSFEEDVIRRSTIARLLSCLSQRERQVIELHFFEDKSVAEISKIIGRTPVTVRNIINRAIARMKSLVEKGG